MKHYKLAVLTAVMTTLAAAHAQNTDNNSPATISIMDYANKNTLAGTAAKQFVFMRCAALYMFFASTQVAAGRSKEADELSAITVKFTIAAANLEGNTKGTFVGTQIAKMNDMYSERAQTAKARIGNWSDDNIIRSDGEACRQVVQ